MVQRIPVSEEHKEIAKRLTKAILHRVGGNPLILNVTRTTPHPMAKPNLIMTNNY